MSIMMLERSGESIKERYGQILKVMGRHWRNILHRSLILITMVEIGRGLCEVQNGNQSCEVFINKQEE
ncbi:hypothetical protein LINGRAHAP2_LOCUS29142 [Linum grandiflorum]